MNTVILSALGTGAYREARYQSEHHSDIITTGLFAVALHRWYPQAEVKLLATDAAWDSANGDYVKKHHPDFERVRIPEGRTEAEAWELFGAMTDAVPPGSRVIFDITHGLRSLPMLGFLALSYLRVVRNVTIERVYYGALELTPREEGALTPVVDLTPLVRLLDWAQAAKRFQDTGDASLFTGLLRVRGPGNLNSVADCLGQLSTALASNRTVEVGELSGVLLEKLGRWEQENTLAQHRPFLQVADTIKATMQPLQAREDERLNLLSHHAQIAWYRERGHWVQAVGLAREWLVSVLTWQQTDTLQLKRKHREDAERLLGQYAKTPQAAPAELQAAAALWDELTDLRNDLAHFGMREDSRTRSTKLKEKVNHLLDKLPDAVRPLGLDLEDAALERPA
ncbi:TIGR02221 family CRISPR-associated protein [Deinococcus geothermalis]|uniref:CRISPR-associated protein, Csx2 family n=1 Tax=Deinococcus geothermalis (strain DSM 11300 / CIP 105573 / AG-3a) TaxID=319795 RepID=Q1IZS5_DEIGD|nr:TIGR02221 family CRISPR-associated protein [Deinococcus geothermalis]ABF45259.1 CRISPR-associated protein, Csx2 family [Deinococcus geothermalis DSM 11300]